MQIDHAARPSILFNVRDSFNDFLKQASTDNEGVPASLEQLQAKAGIKVIMSDRNDPDSAGFVQWRTSFFVGGDDGSLSNFLCLLDDFFVFKSKQLAKDVAPCKRSNKDKGLNSIIEYRPGGSECAPTHRCR